MAAQEHAVAKEMRSSGVDVNIPGREGKVNWGARRSGLGLREVEELMGQS